HVTGVQTCALPISQRFRGFAGGLPLGIVEGDVVDQAAWPADFRHHPVAGVDAQRARDTADLGTFANIDPGRADGDALHAVDAVAEVFGILLRLLDASTRFTAPVLVSDGQRFLVHHRRLD